MCRLCNRFVDTTRVNNFVRQYCSIKNENILMLKFLKEIFTNFTHHVFMSLGVLSPQGVKYQCFLMPSVKAAFGVFMRCNI